MIDFSQTPATVVDALRRVASLEDHGFTFMDGAGNETFCSFGELARIAEQKARAFMARGLRPGDRVALVLSQPRDFVTTFYGALAGGLVPVPMFPPLSFGRLDAYVDSAVRILSTAGARLIVADRALASVLWQVVPKVPSLDDLVAPDALTGGDPSVALPVIQSSDVAFLQFTSGSTSAPKGVRVTHGSLVANCQAIAAEGMGLRFGEDKAVSWLPLYHDMGLIGFVITPLFRAIDVLFIPTLSFVKRPNLWLQSMHRFQGTTSFGPNFAFALATRKATEAELSTWDLSRVRILGCGAEPIHSSVISSFIERFARCGLRPEAVMPAYGMAEATLAVTFGSSTEPVRVLDFDAEAFRETRRVEPRHEGGTVLTAVSCGRPFSGHTVVALGPDGERLGEGEEGEVWIEGPSLADGYWENPEATAAAFVDGGLRTGDLGFVFEGELYITGRLKDLIILNGRNHHPQTIEWAAAEADGVRKGNVVAFSRPGVSSEELVVVCETRESPPPDLAGTVARVVSEQLSLSVADVVLLKVGQLPKTSSGKLQRQKTREQYLSGELGGEGVRTLGTTGETLTVARHLGRSLLGRARHGMSRLLGGGAST